MGAAMPEKRKTLSAAERAAYTKGQSRFVIDPRTNEWMPVWDLVMLSALGFTASFTPYEVTFLTEANVLRDGPDALWVVNRVMDALFILDILLICNTMYEQPLEMGGMWVGIRRQIIWNYMRTPWFWIDTAAVFPFYAVGWALAGDEQMAPDYGSERGGSLATVRLVKLLRMLKIARVLKASRILKRHLQEMVMGYLELTYGVLTAIELLAGLIFYAHLQACFWALFSSFTAEPTWVSTFEADHLASHGVPPAPWELYMAAVRRRPRLSSFTKATPRCCCHCRCVSFIVAPSLPPTPSLCAALLVDNDGDVDWLRRDASGELGGTWHVLGFHAALGGHLDVHPLHRRRHRLHPRSKRRPLPDHHGRERRHSARPQRAHHEPSRRRCPTRQAAPHTALPLRTAPPLTP